MAEKSIVHPWFVGRVLWLIRRLEREAGEIRKAEAPLDTYVAFAIMGRDEAEAERAATVEAVMRAIDALRESIPPSSESRDPVALSSAELR